MRLGARAGLGDENHGLGEGVWGRRAQGSQQPRDEETEK